MTMWVELLLNGKRKAGTCTAYNTAGMGGAWNYTVNHYLLFERGQ